MDQYWYITDDLGGQNLRGGALWASASFLGVVQSGNPGAGTTRSPVKTIENQPSSGSQFVASTKY